MRKIIDILIIIVVWTIIGYIGSKFVTNYNWDFFVGGLIGYILAIIFYHNKPNIYKENKTDTHTDSEIDDAPWYH